MITDAAGFTGDIPAHYDRGLGPNLFDAYGEALVTRGLGAFAGDVLELAAGTGIVSRKLRSRMPPESRLVVTDLNAPMLEVARRKFAANESVDFRVADALALPFEDASFDLVLCQFGVMFFPDKVAGFREAARVLRPGGRYVFNVWSAMPANPFGMLADEVGARFFPDDPPGFYKVPFHYGDPEAVRADLAAAGWQDISHETLRMERTIAEPRAFAEGLVHGNPLIDEIRARGGVDPDEVVAALLAALRIAFGPQGMTMPLSATQFLCRRA